MTSHAQLSPSKRSQWRRCPGSVREQAKYPDTGSGPAAIDGTHTHSVLEHCIKAGVADALPMVGVRMSDHEGEFVIDDSRAKRVQVAIDYIRDRVATHNGLCHVIAESRVDPGYLIGRNDMSGTVDVQIVSADMVEVIDYKDGMGFVDVVGNDQLEQYSLGVLAGYKLPVNGVYPVTTIRNTIIQPKLTMKGGSAIASVEMPVSEILGKIPQMVSEAAATGRPDAPLVPGESQCKFCRAKGGCSALASNVMKEIGVMFTPVLDVAQQSANKDPSTMDNAQICQIIEAAPLMRQMLEGVEAEALRRLKSGISVPGLKLVNGRGSRSWSLGDDEIAERLIRMGMPKGVVYETKVLSPAKVEKTTWESTKKGEKFQKQLTERQMKTIDTEYVTKLAGKLTVAPESDSRPAVNMNAAPLFSAVEPTLAVEQLPSWLL